MALNSKAGVIFPRPKIITQDGHLVFQTGTNHNITFKAGAGGGFLVNDIDLVRTVTDVSEVHEVNKH